MKEKLAARLKELLNYRRSGEWANPVCNRFTNGYNKALDEEIEFLRVLLCEKEK